MHSKLETMIAEHPFLAGIRPSLLRPFYHCATMKQYGAGQEVFVEGQPADHFYLIREGEVALETSVPGLGNKRIQTIGLGEALGWSWLFPPHLWHFTARSIHFSELIALEAKVLRNIADKDAVFRTELVARIAYVLLQRLQSTRLQLLDLYLNQS